MKIKQIALCASILALVGCGGTPSSDKSQSTGSGGAQGSNAFQALIDQRKNLQEKLDARNAEIQRLTKNIESEQNIDKKIRLVDQLEGELSQANTYLDDITKLDKQLDALENTAPAAKPRSGSVSKEPQTRQEYIDALAELTWQEFGDTLIKYGEVSSKEEFVTKTKADLNKTSDAELKQAYKEEKAKAEMGGSSSLSSGAANLSHRNVRLGKGEFRTLNFNFNGQSMDKSFDVKLPVVVQLKGNLDTTGKSSDAVGSMAYNLNGWGAGFVHGYAKTINQLETNESAVMVSKSFKGLFVEGQVGSISGVNRQSQQIAGTRYLVTLGYDSAKVSPFVQYQHLRLVEVEKKGVYVGLDTDVLSVQTSDATLTSKVLAKVGYEPGFKTNISAYVEWSSALKLSDGVEISHALNLGTNDQAVKLNVSFEQ